MRTDGEVRLEPRDGSEMVFAIIQVGTDGDSSRAVAVEQKEIGGFEIY